MLFDIFIIILIILLVLLIVVLLRPSQYRFTRTATLDAPPHVVFPYVNHLGRWPEWSPWQKLDPNMNYSYSGPAAGLGASVHWVGNKKAGEGRMTITESHPHEIIRMRLEFIKPFASICATHFTFQPAGNGTLVTWSMSGNANFLMKGMGIFVNLDKAIGRDFETGLANLATVTSGVRAL